jgi:hypothetical protein
VKDRNRGGNKGRNKLRKKREKKGNREKRGVQNLVRAHTGRERLPPRSSLVVMAYTRELLSFT